MARRLAGGAVLAVLISSLTPTPAAAGPMQPPNLRERSWHLDAMNVTAAQSYVRGEGVTVAVIDTGVDPDSEALGGQVLPGTEITPEGTAGDGRKDYDGHGTGMANLIAGKGLHEDSPLGVAPAAKILPVKITREYDGAFSSESVYRAVVWAVDHGAKVISMSLGGPPTPEADWKRRMVQYALDHDVVLVAAAGNMMQGQDGPRVSEPAAIPGVIAVSALNKRGDVWAGSQTGPEVVVSAPGELLPHTTSKKTTNASGTSGAAALVAGVVALIRARYPQSSAADVVNRLIRTAKDRGERGRDVQYGFGTVDALAAVIAEVPRVDRYPLATTAQASASPQPEAAPEDRSAPLGPWLGIGGLLAAVLLAGLVAWRTGVTRPRFGAGGPGRLASGKFTQRPLVTVPDNRPVEGPASSGRPAQDDG
ncbi:S8 family serine peptidase [Longispora albida]|uniref:S8 family serine peptidase n=1 Tax=Longispora albida TaxID=203523 RepID=UPI0012FAFAD7|nr:S8 family serine peptidase [Longispora albida]